MGGMGVYSKVTGFYSSGLGEKRCRNYLSFKDDKCGKEIWRTGQKQK